jgi:antitoxin component of MazEF toxin-antitoxin module
MAAKLDAAVRYPRPLMDKLGIKPDSVVSVLGVNDADFRAQLAARVPRMREGKARKDSDVIVVRIDSRRELPRLKKLRAAIKKNGAIWVVWPKGRKEFREDDVRAYGPEVGLVDVKVVSVSDVLSGLKMVIPVKLR